MKRNRIVLTREEIFEILKAKEYGVISSTDSENKPYSTPLNYVFSEDENAIYFHCSKQGRKINNIKENPYVSFCVVGCENLIPELFVTNYRSVIAEGKAEIVEDLNEKRRILNLLCKKFSSEFEFQFERIIEKNLSITQIVKINIESVFGKENSDSKED